MTGSVHIAGEAAYDLVSENLPLLLHLLDGPSSAAEVAGRVGMEEIETGRRLEKLRRHGIVEEAAGAYRAVASRLYRPRQEGMLDFVKENILPGLADGMGRREVENFYMTLSDEEMRGLRPGKVEALMSEILAVSDNPAAGERPLHCSVLIIGTSLVRAVEQDLCSRILGCVKSAAIQRSVESEKDKALLLKVDMLVSGEQFGKIKDCLKSFTADLKRRSCDVTRINYNLTVACVAAPSTARGEKDESV